MGQWGCQINKSIALGLLSGVGLTASSIAVAFVQLRLILKYLPEETAGVWLLFLSLGAYIAFFDLGVSPTLSREISFIVGRKDLTDKARDQKIADLLSVCFKIFLIMAVVVFFLGLIAGGAFIKGISPIVSRQEIGNAWIVFISGTSINILAGVVYASLFGLGNVATEKTIRAVTQVIGLVLYYVCLRAGFGIIGLAVAWVVQNILGRIVATLALYHYHPWLSRHKGEASRGLFAQIITPSLKWAAMGLGALLILQTDKIIIVSCLGPSSIPQYEAVVKIAFSLMAFSLLIVNTTTPFLSRAHAAGSTQEVRTTLLRNVRISMATIVFFGSFMGIFGREVINVWLGPGNFVGFPVLWTILIMTFLEVHHTALAAGTMATGRLPFVWMAVGAGALNIIIGLMLVRPLGLLGVALGTMVAQMLTNNWYAPALTLRHFSISKVFYLRSVVVPILCMLLVCVGWNVAISRLPGADSIALSLAIALIFSSILGATIFYYIILTSNERTAIRARFAR